VEGAKPSHADDGRRTPTEGWRMSGFRGFSHADHFGLEGIIDWGKTRMGAFSSK
jgi:hypothetical protein